MFLFYIRCSPRKFFGAWNSSNNNEVILFNALSWHNGSHTM